MKRSRITDDRPAGIRAGYPDERRSRAGGPAYDRAASMPCSPGRVSTRFHGTSSRPASRCGICESFQGRLRDELLNETPFFGLDHARSVLARWVSDFNACRPHSALGYQTPEAYAAQLTAP